MVIYRCLGEIERDIHAAETIEDIGNIFRDVFASGITGFSAQSSIAVEAIYTALERLNSQRTKPSPIELHDLYNTFIAANTMTFNLREEISSGNPAYEALLKAAETVVPKALKQEAESVGKVIMEEIKPEIDFATHYEKYRKMLERLRKDDFRKAREDMAQAISNRLSRSKPPIPPISMLCRFNEIDKLSYSDCPAKYWHILEDYRIARDECFQNPPDKWLEYKTVQKDAEHFIDELVNQFSTIHEDFADALNSHTDISHEQALEWARSNIYMDKNVEAKLRRIGYPKQNLIEDVAEVFRYVGGKLAPIEFIGTRSARAFAYSSKYQIAISRNFDKRTLFHECGHLVESVDTISLQCSYSFRKERSQGKSEKLSDLTGNSGYSSQEIASPDSFISPYVGKIYDHPASEVFSMAMEKMASKEDLVRFIKGDPEHFALFLGICAHSNPELSGRLKRLSENSGKRQAIRADGEKAFQEWEKAIKKAMPEFFMNALLEPEGVAGFFIKSGGDSPAAKSILAMRDPMDPGSYMAITYGGTVASNAKAAYLAIMAIRKQLDFGFEAPTRENLSRICNSYIVDGKVPDWFDKNEPLPPLELPPDVQAKARKNNPKAFLGAVAAATPPDLFERLQKGDGVEGFMVADWITPKSKNIGIIHKETDDSIYCGPKSVLPMAYLLIMNKRNLLPEHESSVYMAGRKFIYYALGKEVPDWFEPGLPLPELKYD